MFDDDYDWFEICSPNGKQAHPYPLDFKRDRLT